MNADPTLSISLFFNKKGRLIDLDRDVYVRIFLKFGWQVCAKSRMHKYDIFISSKVKVTGNQKVKIFCFKYLSHLLIDFHETWVKYIWSQVLSIYL